MSDLLETFRRSQKEFEKLAEIPTSGIRWQEHYELSHESTQFPSYLRALYECSGYGSSVRHLSFHEALETPVTGWVARVLYAEMFIYVRFLYDRYQKAGGVIITKNLDRNELADLQGDVLINCSGLEARELFGDVSLFPIRGYLMFIEGAPFPPAQDGHVFSYNYKPPDGEYLYDAYFFPREGTPTGGKGWLLGGTRESGRAATDQSWKFDPLPYEKLGEVPRPMFEINRRILLRLTGVDIADYPFQIYFGYRPARDAGVRLELVREFGKYIVHNYGHGGGGVSLSWGCAIRVGEMINGLV
jgi:glycine/D-amino acid oxidase-like deaminating enzyme